MKKRLSINKESTNKTINEAVSDFIKYCKIKNLSEATIHYYTQVLGIFKDFTGEETQINSITIDIIDSYTLRLLDSTSNVSVNTRLRGVRAFMYYCMERGYCKNFKIRLVKQDDIVKETYTDAELSVLLSKPDMKTCSFCDYRNWAAVNFLVGTGVRLSTLISIQVGDIDLQSGVFKTRHNKNRREQVLPISKVLNKVLEEYLIHRNHDSQEDILFCNQYGQKLSTNGFEHALVKYGKRRGVPGVSCHKFRHTFSKNWILSGGDVFRLQKMLGHSSMDIVRKYVNIYGNELQKDFEQFNPLDRLAVEKKPIQIIDRAKR